MRIKFKVVCLDCPTWENAAINEQLGCLQNLGGRNMLNLLKTTGAVVASLASLAFLSSNVALAGISHVQEAANAHVSEAASTHVQEAAAVGATHVQEAEIQLLESAGLETVVIDGEVGHVL